MDAFEAILTRRSTRKLAPELPKAELIERVIDAGRHAPSGSNSQSTHFIVITSPRVLAELADLVRAAFAQMEVGPDTYVSLRNSVNASKRGGYVFHYGASVITVVFPEWYAQLSKEETQKPANRRKLELTILMYRKVLGIDWDDMVVAYISDDHPEYEGKTIPQCAEEEGLSNLDMYLKLVDLSDRAGSIYLGKYYNDEIVRRLMNDELSVFMTDAWVEEKGLQNIAAFQTFPQFFLLAVRDGIPIQKVVRKMTGLTADRYQIPDRGYLKPGYKADITVIDIDNMKVNEEKPDFRPEGIVHVYVNGQAVLEDGKYIGGKAGKVLLKK